MSTEPKRVKGHEILQIAAAKALEDPAYHARLMQNPKEVLREEGLTVADDVELVIHENSPKRLHLVLPPESAPPGDRARPRRDRHRDHPPDVAVLSRRAQLGEQPPGFVRAGDVALGRSSASAELASRMPSSRRAPASRTRASPSRASSLERRRSRSSARGRARSAPSRSAAAESPSRERQPRAHPVRDREVERPRGRAQLLGEVRARDGATSGSPDARGRARASPGWWSAVSARRTPRAIASAREQGVARGGQVAGRQLDRGERLLAGRGHVRMPSAAKPSSAAVDRAARRVESAGEPLDLGAARSTHADR